ncbi:sodium transport system ATP-binding protein [Acholeplasma morum]|uniref:ABC transporter ATP-binding protein n=1 Tax=Paracholeplasma morum TaxID=264637 RepID=UPI00195B1B2C|nr:ATP-binding cassette domain-containing protein [Paracholeplasma morum]MBM7453750.1 sodium transport system ATP-binding protein [Paracholeplasma morum]
MSALLEVKDLVKTFSLSKKQQRLQKTKDKRKTAVDHLSFRAYKGEIYGLLGPNGAGKTTTLRIISALIKPDEGEAIVDGVSVSKDPDMVHSKIGFLTSELKLEDFFTPNYLYDYFSELHHVDKEVAKVRKEALFKKFGIDEFREVKVSELSTGMKQKVSLVISIVHNPNIIIFDEPTNGLDIITAKIVTDFLLDLKKEGKTLILSTHIFSLVEKLCDRVGIIIDGKMAYEGYVNDIMKNSSLEDLFFNLYEASRGDLNE